MPRSYGGERATPPDRARRPPVPGGLSLSPEQTSALRVVRAAADLLAKQDRPEAARLLDERLRLDPLAPQVVVVGEAKRGKSSLVNALLERPDLSPVGTDVTTALPLRFFPAADGGTGEDRATLRFADGTERPVSLPEMPLWASGQLTVESTEPGIESIDVHLGGGRPRGGVLVDTPGAGGLAGGHTRLALLAAARAGVLVLVADAGQPLTEAELGFLREAAGAVDSVLVALTKVDKYGRAVAHVREDDRALLRTHAPRLAEAPIVEVSSEWARRAQDLPPELSSVLRDRSGVPRLDAEVADRLTRLGDLHVRNALRSASHLLGQQSDQLGARLAAAKQEPGAVDTALAERARLTALRDQEGRWSLELERDLRRIRSQAVKVLEAEVVRIREEWRERVDRQRTGFQRSVAEDLTADLRADLAALSAHVAELLERGVAEVVTGLLDQDVDPALLSLLGSRPERPAPAPAPSGLKDVLEPGVISTGAIGAGLGAQVLGGAGLVAGAVFLPVLAGAAFVGLTTMYKQVQLARRRQREWAMEEIARARNQAVAHLDDVINEVRPEVVASFRLLLTARIREVQAVVEEADLAASRDSASRHQRITVLEAQLAAVAARRHDVDGLLAAVR